MQIYGPFRLSTAQAASSLTPTSANSGSSNRIGSGSTAQPSTAPIDQLDLSSAARTTSAGSTNRIEGNSAIAGGGEIRIDRVADLRRQIAAGTYDTPEKMDAALDRFLDEFV